MLSLCWCCVAWRNPPCRKLTLPVLGETFKNLGSFPREMTFWIVHRAVFKLPSGKSEFGSLSKSEKEIT
jgi:hypothetical protein